MTRSRRVAGNRAAARLRPRLNHETARTGIGSRITRARAVRRAPRTAPARVDAGVQEQNEMTIGRTEDPENPIRVTASRSRRTVWDWIADPIWASGHAPRQQAGHMNAVDHPSESSPMFLNPRGRPHMQHGHRPLHRACQLSLAQPEPWRERSAGTPRGHGRWRLTTYLPEAWTTVRMRSMGQDRSGRNKI
jgi:hypothetical protein